jgi:hypothetical protein
MLEQTVFVAPSTSTADALTFGDGASADASASSPVEAGGAQCAAQQAAAAALVEPAASPSTERVEEAASEPGAGDRRAATRGRPRWKWTRGQYAWIAGRWICVFLGFHHWLPSRWFGHGRDARWVDGRWIS